MSESEIVKLTGTGKVENPSLVVVTPESILKQLIERLKYVPNADLLFSPIREYGVALGEFIIAQPGEQMICRLGVLGKNNLLRGGVDPAETISILNQVSLPTILDICKSRLVTSFVGWSEEVPRKKDFLKLRQSFDSRNTFIVNLKGEDAGESIDKISKYLNQFDTDKLHEISNQEPKYRNYLGK